MAASPNILHFTLYHKCICADLKLSQCSTKNQQNIFILKENQYLFTQLHSKVEKETSPPSSTNRKNTKKNKIIKSRKPPCTEPSTHS